MIKAKKTPLHEYSLTLILDGVESWEELEAGIYGAGCDDTLVGMRSGIAFVDFDREAESLSAAIMSAIDDIKTIQGVSILRIEPDDVVNMSEIAARLGQSRESIRKYINNERRSGGFPAPVSNVTGRSMRWRWNEVAKWLIANGKLPDNPTLREATLVSKLNTALELRRMTSSKKELREVLQLVE
jgi:predicted DNA-binding transcriptional regulator AlpA